MSRGWICKHLPSSAASLLGGTSGQRSGFWAPGSGEDESNMLFIVGENDLLCSPNKRSENTYVFHPDEGSNELDKLLVGQRSLVLRHLPTLLWTSAPNTVY